MQNDAGTNNPGKIVYYVTMNPLCAIELDLDFNENLDGVGAEGTDDTVANFPNEYDNTADIINNTLTLTSKIPARNNYIFTGWNTEADGSGTSYQPGAVIRVGDGADELTGNVTLYAIWEVGEAYTVTVNFSEHDVNNVEFHHTNYVTQEVTENGGMAVLRANENYSIIINYKNGYMTDTITTTANGTIGNITVSGITYTITGNDTITITSEEKTGTTTLDTGQNFNTKIKTLAEGK
ncbi:InlB B-repeat-containing protein, partial [Candidatus Saccharibacteria bacterium]|nr:InlB B-repeat-containing protein [Candidatus Saccharibacteria bacterium]